MKQEKFYLTFDQWDAAWCSEQAHWIMENIPLFQKSNGSGKFFDCYESYQFHKSSEIPLIKKFVESLEQNADKFYQCFQRKLELNFISLAVVRDASQEICIYHRDGHFWHGQCHLTILGNANIMVKDRDQEQLLRFPNGTLWYLNGTNYQHKIKPTQGLRLELCAPVSERPQDVERKLLALSNCENKYLNSKHPEWLKLRAEQVAYIKKAIQKGTASNLEVANFNSEVNE